MFSTQTGTPIQTMPPNRTTLASELQLHIATPPKVSELQEQMGPSAITPKELIGTITTQMSRNSIGFVMNFEMVSASGNCKPQLMRKERTDKGGGGNSTKEKGFSYTVWADGSATF